MTTCKELAKADLVKAKPGQSKYSEHKYLSFDSALSLQGQWKFAASEM